VLNTEVGRVTVTGCLADMPAREVPAVEYRREALGDSRWWKFRRDDGVVGHRIEAGL